MVVEEQCDINQNQFVNTNISIINNYSESQDIILNAVTAKTSRLSDCCLEVEFQGMVRFFNNYFKSTGKTQDGIQPKYLKKFLLKTLKKFFKYFIEILFY